METAVQIPLYVIIGYGALSLLIAYFSTPAFRQKAVAADNAAEAWSADKTALNLIVPAAIAYAEEHFILLTGPERMNKAIAFCASRGLFVTKAQVQLVFDLMKTAGLFGIKSKSAPPKEGA